MSIRLFVALFAACACVAACAATVVQENPVWPRPIIVPVPDSTAGVAQTSVVLHAWQTNANPQGEFWGTITDPSLWHDVPTGGRGGFGFGRGGGNSNPLSAFRTTAEIPLDYTGHRVLLRFEGVSNSAKVWVNGKFVRDHWGSFMPFTCDITNFVEPGKAASIVVGVDDSRTGLAQYVRAGGLQRDVKLFAAPMDYVTRFHVQTTFDAQYKNATMKVWLRMDLHGAEHGRATLSLKNAQGHEVALSPTTIDLSRETPETITDIPVAQPLQWDAEHPNLYTLSVNVMGADGAVQETLTRHFGFMQIERRGRQVLVNGHEVKLRGLWGGNSIQDMVDNNINHTRQKWVTDEMLDDADRLGVYITDENPVDFARNPVASDPKFLSQYMNFMADLVERDRDHPSVLMWGLDNESEYGTNVEPTFRYVSTEDPTRQTQFSWGSEVPVNRELPYNVYSFHYPPIHGDFASYGYSAFNNPSHILERAVQPVIPVIADEYAHLPIYDPDEWKRDPNVHNFWGESIKLYWEKMFATEGALGGDIFGLPGARGALPPEYWLIKEAYSPVRVEGQTLVAPVAGKPLQVAVKNWFDTTNLNELSVHWSAAELSGDLRGPTVAPHGRGVLNLPAGRWSAGEAVHLTFQLVNGRTVQESVLQISPGAHALPVMSGPAPRIAQDANSIIVTGGDFKISFSRETGMITSGTFHDSEILRGGPFLHIVAADQEKNMLTLPAWTLSSITTTRSTREVVVHIAGSYGPAQVTFEMHIDGAGLIATTYKLGAFPFAPPAAHPRPWNGSHVGGFSEVGLAFALTPQIDRLSWERKALWSYYPADHIGRAVGIAQRTSSNAADATWAQSNSNNGPRAGFMGGPPGAAPGAAAPAVANDFRAMKEYIYRASALDGGTDAGFEAVSDGHDAVRMESTAPDSVTMIVNNEWNYPQLGNSNYMKPPISVSAGYSGTVRTRFIRSTPQH